MMSFFPLAINAAVSLLSKIVHFLNVFPVSIQFNYSWLLEFGILFYFLTPAIPVYIAHVSDNIFVFAG